MKDTEIKVNNKTVGEYDMIPDDNRPDWNINDENDPRYIKDRPFYSESETNNISSESVDILQHEPGFIFKVANGVYASRLMNILQPIMGLEPGSTNQNMPRIKQVYYATDAKREMTRYYEVNRIGQAYNYITVDDMGGHASNPWGYNKCVNILDKTGNYKTVFKVYFLNFVDFMTQESKAWFNQKGLHVDGEPDEGVYIEYVAAPSRVEKYCKISFELMFHQRLKEYYLPFNINDTKFKIPNTTLDDSGKMLAIDIDGKPVWLKTLLIPPTTTELAGKILRVNSAGTPEWTTVNGIPAFTAADAGKILTIDSEGNLVWVGIQQSGGDSSLQ